MLTITLAEHKIDDMLSDDINVVCSHVLIKCHNLTCLKFDPCSDDYVAHGERLSLKMREIQSFRSSNLLKLHINVETFTDCLYLLDGRFEQLHTLKVYVRYLIPRQTEAINEVDHINNQN